ncbi:FtsW/RodA/SpoVE family cell cycle protein [Neobacillus sp.]|uniref:FtsW/RodA/SpoVE family cell cycle protein n=1 Tax=Neobacillus sp. TaxID=2675273 RepID=UPI0028A2D5A5|nr:FtsW/RodA/SpoVE family cell cycle protein [Neobacillus sp.]
MMKKEFLDSVMTHVRSKDIKKIVTKELEQHIKVNIEHYIKEGYSEEVAEQKAVEQMGSPLAIGTKFNKIYKPKLDWGLVLLFLTVLGLGTLPLIALKNTDLPIYWGPKVYGISLGILIVAILLCFDYKKWERKGWILFTIGTIILFIAGNAITPPLLVSINGRPHFHIGPFITDTTIVLPFYLVAWASFFKNHKLKIWLLGILFIGTLLLFFGTINFPAVSIYLIMVLTMYCFSGRKHIFKTTILTSIAGLIGLTVIWQRMYPFQKERIYAFLDPQSYSSTTGYIPIQIEKILKEVTWGFQAIPKNALYPELHTDFVFLTLTYSYGWGFSLFLLAILTVIFIKMALMTAKIKDEFGKLLIIGGLTIYSAQLLYNIGMIFGFLPIIRMSLPFISYGTVPILINSLVIGIALSIYRRKNLICN